MKKIILSFLLLSSFFIHAQVGIGVATANINASAQLEVTSTTKGFLPPRMTHAQKMAIASPAQGLMIYCSNCGSKGEPEYYNGAEWVNMTGGAAASVPITIGATYGGGIVFYVFQQGDPGYVAGQYHGLIAATVDCDQGYATWGCYGTFRRTSTVLGSGAANTTILSTCGENSIAAKRAVSFNGGGFTDWYLPSKDELNLLYTNKNLVGASGFVHQYGDNYWTSTDNSYGYAYYQDFNDGSQQGQDKNTQMHVRAIRTF